jgi:DNA-binding GntR family transcriptional regulator
MNAPVPHSRLKPRPLYEEVAELLRQRIFAGKASDMEPGAWIDELKLAQEYGISRTPLREAMKMRRGAYVTEVNAKDLRDVFHLMAVLEADAAGTVASTATAAQLQALEALHQQLEKAARDRKDHLRFFQLNEAFHVKLLEVANNRWAGQMVADLRKVMKLNRAQSLLKAGRIEESLAEHAAIMAALKKRDAAAAQAAMRAHIESGQEAAG